MRSMWGHSIIDLLDTLPVDAKPADTLLEKSRALDRYYIPTRYPDVHPAGPAARHYTAQEARDIVGIAREVVEHCEHQSLEA